MRTKSKLTTRQRDAIKRAIYLLRVAAFSDIVQEDATATYDGVKCDGYCFREDSGDAAEHLESVFGPFKMPEDTPVDDEYDDTDPHDFL